MEGRHGYVKCFCIYHSCKGEDKVDDKLVRTLQVVVMYSLIFSPAWEMRLHPSMHHGIGPVADLKREKSSWFGRVTAGGDLREEASRSAKPELPRPRTRAHWS